MSHFKQPIRGNPTKSLGIEQFIILKAYRLSELNYFFILKIANIRCFILIAVAIFHNIMLDKKKERLEF
jgi:hypothetical protein